jgi:hypothetical protein
MVLMRGHHLVNLARSATVELRLTLPATRRSMDGPAVAEPFASLIANFYRKKEKRIWMNWTFITVKQLVQE